MIMSVYRKSQGKGIKLKLEIFKAVIHFSTQVARLHVKERFPAPKTRRDPPPTQVHLGEVGFQRNAH